MSAPRMRPRTVSSLGFIEALHRLSSCHPTERENQRNNARNPQQKLDDQNHQAVWLRGSVTKSLVELPPETATHQTSEVGPGQQKEGRAPRMGSSSGPRCEQQQAAGNVVFKHGRELHGPITAATTGRLHNRKEQPNNKRRHNFKSHEIGRASCRESE